MLVLEMIPVTALLTEISAVLVTFKLTDLHVTQVFVANQVTVVHVRPNLIMLQDALVVVFALVVAELSAGRSLKAVLGAFIIIVPIPDTINIYLPIKGSVGFVIFDSFIDISTVNPLSARDHMLCRVLFSLIQRSTATICGPLRLCTTANPYLSSVSGTVFLTGNLAI
jgi:hypothetical protein